MEPQLPATYNFGDSWRAYSTDWFSRRIPKWTEMLVPALAGKPVRILEIGSFEGRSAVWMLGNLLAHPAAKLVCVDLWNRPETERRFDANILLTGQGHKVVKLKGDSKLRLRHVQGRYDFIYVDAEHTGQAVMSDSVMSWPLLAKGGFMVWDDYHIKAPTPGARTVKEGVDAFLCLWGHELKVVHRDYQVIARKV